MGLELLIRKNLNTTILGMMLILLLLNQMKEKAF